MASKKDPLVSIVILNWNGLEDTKLCLEYVRKLKYSNYEIIVVDNGSSSSEKEYLSKIEDIVYIDNPTNRGFAGGQSDGYRHSKGDFILLLNNDAVIDSEYIIRALPLFDDPTVAVVGGRSYFWNETEHILDTSNRFYAYMDVNPVTAETTLNMKDNGLVQEVNVVSGSAVLVRRAATEKVGYLWEPFFAYYEETDLFARMKRAGYRILYNPGLHIWHKNGASSGAQSGSLFFYYHIFRNRYMFAIRNFDDDYFNEFKKTYYKSMWFALINGLRGGAHSTIAKAYLKAAFQIRKLEPRLQTDRAELKKTLNNDNYSRMIIAEQTAISVVIDATKLNQKAFTKLHEEISETKDKLQEYIIVVPKQLTDTLASTGSNIRYVVDRGYFDTHPVNLGCIAAKYDWTVITDPGNLKKISFYRSLIVKNQPANFKAIELGEASLIINKSLFELMGGFTNNKDSLSKNIEHALKYAYVDNSLISQNSLKIAEKETSEFRNQIDLDYELFTVRELSYWQKLLNRYYRLQQLDNLLAWIAHPKLPLRLKIARTKNIILSVFTLDRLRLATELKHIRNEVFRQSKFQTLHDTKGALKIQADAYSQEQIKDLSSIPVFIITFERIDELKGLVKKLEAMGLKKIVFIDNGSTYPPLISYLINTPYQVLSLKRNIGHTAPWSLAITRALTPFGYYIVTDPDVIPTDQCVEHNPLGRMIELHKKYPEYHKVGMSLKIDDLPDYYPLKGDVIAWEKQFWENELEPNVYEASVDTTFAMYKPTSHFYVLGPSIRLGEPFSARHAPWYKDPSQQTEEDIYYKLRADSGVTSWNVDELPERYKKEMNRAKKI